MPLRWVITHCNEETVLDLGFTTLLFTPMRRSSEAKGVGLENRRSQVQDQVKKKRKKNSTVRVGLLDCISYIAVIVAVRLLFFLIVPASCSSCFDSPYCITLYFARMS